MMHGSININLALDLCVSFLGALARPQCVAIWLAVSCVWFLHCAAHCLIDTLLSRYSLL